jgi:hypothetical protein
VRPHAHAPTSSPPKKGLLAGKALYDGLLLDLALAPPLVLALQGRRPGADDLAAVDAGLAAGLAAVRGYGGDASDLGLTFSVEYERFGRVRPLALGYEEWGGGWWGAGPRVRVRV